MQSSGNTFAKKALILLPIIVWFYLFREYLLGHMPAMTAHGIDYYHIVKYIMENYTRGVYPMWDPFFFWGRPDTLDARFIGEFNPFHWMYILFSWVGHSRPIAYLLYSLIYHLFGMLGFYLLAQKIFKDKALALFAFVLLLFSTLTFKVFDNLCLTHLFVPFIWFFYFLIAFAKNQSKLNCLGLTFALMHITTTYLPFYFIIIFSTFFASFLILFFSDTKAFARCAWVFLKKNKILAGFCICAIILSAVPGFLWYSFAHGGDFFIFRNYDAPDDHAASMHIDTITAGGLGGQITIRGLVSGFKYSWKNEFYIPIYFYLLLFLSLFNRINRRLILYFITAFIVVVIALADLTPVHRFLYDNVFIFRLFRNIFFLLYLSLPFYILFSIEQLKLLLENLSNSAHRYTKLLALTFTHLLFVWFLSQQGDVIMSSYITIGLSFIILSLYAFGLFQGRKIIFMFLVLVTIMIQPIEVYHYYVKNALGFAYGMAPWYPFEKFSPRFSYERTSRKEDNLMKGEPFGNQDTSGFQLDKYTGLRLSHDVHQNIDHAILETYTKNKFVVYDSVQQVSEESFDFETLKDLIVQKRNVAYVFDVQDQTILKRRGGKDVESRAITQDSDELKVLKFDVNNIRLKTNFQSWKFLVYNDTFHKDWRAFLNGKEVDIIRSNYAFKGLWIPPGENIVYFRYGSLWLYSFNFFLMAFYAVFFVLVLWVWLSPRYLKSKL